MSTEFTIGLSLAISLGAVLLVMWVRALMRSGR